MQRTLLVGPPIHSYHAPPSHVLSLQTMRLPVMTKCLTLEQAGLVLKRAFISPVPGAPAMSEVGG